MSGLTREQFEREGLTVHRIYGTEVFEVNQNLQKLAAGFARKATLNDSDDAIAYRANYASSSIYAAGAAGPAVYECDVATSDVSVPLHIRPAQRPNVTFRSTTPAPYSAVLLETTPHL